MRWFVGRLSAVIGLVFMPMAIATPAVAIAAPGAQCLSTNMSWNEATGECKTPTAPPAWYVAPPAYAPGFAGQDVPPPPLRPAWSPNAPMWSVGFHQWGAYFNGVWVPY
ncbi:hypothetical protein AWC05_27840 [Mycobacterium florentinum]|uniref:Secreted protein n=1 Tax=Mycobacterium florentinum TaxID=292462 RepID=A0A1X1U3J6_MYCFL|nr:hypothetical protein [Mycobacterium florentinum]MCV7411215.1 hypothetical protein [Mycobacterium florentinum]ORV51376.1 hypothetical protein AWC05_27840 [Mycobacterium florentinum]BBX80563.1 hypothetical protein MFLOJ_43500 [Mycobacterium florentinum]